MKKIIDKWKNTTKIIKKIKNIIFGTKFEKIKIVTNLQNMKKRFYKISGKYKIQQVSFWLKSVRKLFFGGRNHASKG